MPATISHSLSATTPDDPAYEIRPSHWNSNHAITLNAVGSEIIGGFSNSNGVSFGTEPGGAVTASYTQSTHAHTAYSFANSNGVSFGTNGSTVTATVKTDYLTTARASADAVGLNTAQTNVTWTVNSSGISLNAGGYAGTGFTSTTTAGTQIKATHDTAGLSMAVPVYLTVAAGAVTLSNWMPYLLMSTQPVSINPATQLVARLDFPAAVAVSAIQQIASIGVGVPGATSQNSSGTVAYSFSSGATFFSRVNYGNSSSQLSMWTTASFGLTAKMTYSSSSQSAAISWVTDSTGGTSSFSTASASNGWSAFLTGGKMIQIPLVTTIPAGEFFVAFQNSSTSGTTGSNVTLLSVSQGRLENSNYPFGTFTSSGTYAAMELFGAYRGSAVTTNATMASSVFTEAGNLGGVVGIPWMNFAGHTRSA